MTTNFCHTCILLVAVLLATVRPVLASNGMLGSPIAARGGSSESKGEREGGESERETANEGAEGRKCRRAATMLCLCLGASLTWMAPFAAEPRLAAGDGCVATATTSEHLLRWGHGAPLRI